MAREEAPGFDAPDMAGLRCAMAKAGMRRPADFEGLCVSAQDCNAENIDAREGAGLRRTEH